MNELLTDELRTTLHDRFGDVAPTPALYDEVQRRIARRRHRRTATFGASAAVVLAAAAILPGLLGDGSLWIVDRPAEITARPDAADADAPGTDTEGVEPLATLDVPDRGTAAAGYLDDGTPVFVTRTDDGVVHVLDALDPHLDSKLIAHCPSTGVLLDPRAGSRYLLDGSYAGGGPSPRDLDGYPVELDAGGTEVTVTGPSRRASGRSTPPEIDGGGWCVGAVRHEPDTSVRQVTLAEAARDDRWRWAYVRRDLHEGELVLCHALRGCDDDRDRLPWEGVPATPPVAHPDTAPEWALVRRDGGTIDARFAPRDIDIVQGPPGDVVEQARWDLVRSPRHLQTATGVEVDDTGDTGELFLRFDEDGWFSADTPCTDRYGRYELLPADRIRFHDVTTIGEGCGDDPVGDVLAEVLDAGERAVEFDDLGGLELTTPAGDSLLYSYL